MATTNGTETTDGTEESGFMDRIIGFFTEPLGIGIALGALIAVAVGWRMF